MKKANNKKPIKLVVSGGHLSPAIAVIEELTNQKDRWQIFFFGRSKSEEGSPALAREAIEIPKLGVEFIAIPAGKIPRHMSLASLIAILRLPLGFLIAFGHLLAIKPDLILSFGGYVAVPIALAGWLIGIPVVTHEQTASKGLATAVLEHLADEVAISWEESRSFFRRKVALTGNPIRRAFFSEPDKKLPIQSNKLPLIYLTGGNLGARKLNHLVRDSLPKLVKHYSLVHQCGAGKRDKDYTELLNERTKLPNYLQARYLVRSWFEAAEVAWLLKHADLVISRAGANIITELALVGTKALLVPLPIAGRQEQLANARLLKAAGTAEIVLQEDLSAERLLDAINAMLAAKSKYEKNIEKTRAKVNPEAAKRLVSLLEEVYEKTQKTS